jgi:uncharacterized membrane protein YhaH (DUF805 family)
MIRKILSYGTIAGLVAGLTLSAVVIGANGQPVAGSMAIGYLIMLVAFSTIFVAVRRHRDVDRGGVIGFWPAFGLGVGISAVAGIFYVASWEASVAVAHLDFGAEYTKALIAEKKAKGVSGAELAKFTAEMKAFQIQYANPLFRLPMTFIEIFPVGVLVSLVSAGLLRNRRFLPLTRR